MKLYAARDKNTGKLVSNITNPRRKFWQRRGDCVNAISNYRWHDYDLELVVFELVESDYAKGYNEVVENANKIANKILKNLQVQSEITMAEYINRQVLLQTLNESKIPYSADINYFITNAPVTDAVEVVRCKNCQHYIKEYHRCSLHSEEPDQISTGFIFAMQEDDFCSYGEKVDFENDEI